MKKGPRAAHGGLGHTSFEWLRGSRRMSRGTSWAWTLRQERFKEPQLDATPRREALRLPKSLTATPVVVVEALPRRRRAKVGGRKGLTAL